MPIHPEWPNLLFRLLCAAAAGFVIGYDRGEHGRPAGLRTTILVALAACVSMIQVNLLLGQSGKSSDSFVVLDLMRLPLGILSGMGFIGAGAILRRDNLVLGVTTAATLWFVTGIGLSFGGGQMGLGLAGVTIGFVVLRGLRGFEGRMKVERQAALTVVVTESGPSQQEIRTRLAAEEYTIRSCALVYSAAAETLKLNCQVSWVARGHDTSIPEFVRTLTRDAGVASVSWSPQARS